MITPLYHAVGLVVWLPAAILVGSTCVLLAGWDADAFVDETARHGITAVLMVPIQLREMLDRPGFDAARLASLQKISCAGAITPPELKAALAEKLPQARFTDHYGQSETGPVCFLKHWHPRDKAGGIGRPALGTEFAVVDANGKPVAPGEVGEIVTRGPFMMEGYYKDPEETAAYFRTGDGWGWSGDLATMDADGFVTLVGRSKDMIVSGGVNIYPREVERVLETHPAGADELIAHCAEHLARFKRPRLVRFVPSIPKTPSGKTLKTRLREEFLKAEEPGPG